MRLPRQLLHRKIDSHKGDFGHILILAGSANFIGAAVLCAHAAIRCGAGLVTIGIPKGLNEVLLKIKPQEVMTLPLPQTKKKTLGVTAYKDIKKFMAKADILAIGPGLSQNKSTQKLIKKVIKTAGKPMVIDADALNALSKDLDLLKNAASAIKIVTPHSAEMMRLTGIDVKSINKNRLNIAKSFAKNYNVTVVLKGKDTVVASQGKTPYINKTGNPGMSTAGSGDVLTGIIASFLSQGLSAFDASKYGAFIHGLAADIAASKKTQMGMISSDIIDNIPAAIKKYS